jgi:hypothetical protein
MASESAQSVSPRQLWFGFAGSAGAWLALGVADILLAWQACLGQEQYGGAHSKPGFLTLFIVVTAVLFAIAVSAGITSYRNWQALSQERSLSDAEARGRREYMALAGVFISLTLGIGIVWLGIPLAIISFCVRAR